MATDLQLLLQNVQFEGPLGIVVALAVLLLTLWGGYKGGVGLWKAVGQPIKNRIAKARIAEFEQAFIDYLGEWFDHQRDLAVFLIDADIRIMFASECALELLDVEFDDLRGRKWQRLANTSEDLSRVIQKWNDAKNNQLPYMNIGTFMVKGIEMRFRTKAEPFIYRNKVRYYLARLQPVGESNVRQLPAAKEQ